MSVRTVTTNESGDLTGNVRVPTGKALTANGGEIEATKAANGSELAESISEQGQAITEVSQVVSAQGQAITDEVQRVDGLVSNPAETPNFSPDAWRSATGTMPIGKGFRELEANGFFFGSHRGSPLINPESTLEAYRSQVASGIHHIEVDVHLLADGAIAVMHDSTVDRTTDGTGATRGFSAHSFRKLTIDTTITQEQGLDDVHPPLFPDVLTEFGNRVPMLIEPKSLEVCAPLLRMLQQFAIDPDMVIINAFTRSWLTIFRNAGYRVCWNESNYVGSPSPATLANEVSWMLVSDSTSTEQMDALRDAGIKVGVYIIDTHTASKPFLDHCDAIFSDDAIYLQGVSRRTTDPFAAQQFVYGHKRANSNGENSGRGEFVSPNLWGYDLDAADTFAGALMGWANPIGGSVESDSLQTVTITFSVKFEGAFSDTRFAWIALFNEDAAYSSDSNTNKTGYAFVCRKNGSLQIYRHSIGNSGTSIGSQTGTAITDGATATYKITVTPTGLKFERTDVATSLEVADTNFRGPFLHAGVKGIHGYFSGITITT